MSSSEPADAPVPAATAAWAALAIVAAVQFMIVLDATVVNVAAPSIQHSLGFTASSLQWIITVYTLLTSGFQLLGGRASDLVGRRLVFLLGTAVFTAASLFNGLAPSATALIVGRGAQGLGAAFASAAGLAVLLAAFPNARDRSRALAVWTSIAIAGGAAGVLVGGVLTQWLSWPLVFYINVPVGALAILASLRWLPESRDTGTRRRFDLLGALTVTAGTLLLVYAITEAPSRGWASPEVLGTGIGGLVLLMLFVLIERRTPDPLVRLDVFRIRTLSVGNGALMLVGGATFALFLFTSLYVQDILGYAPLVAGLAFLPVFAASVLGAVFAQQLIRRIGTRAVSVAGLLIAAIGLGWLLRLPVDGSYLADLLAPLVIGSIGLGLASVPLTLLATSGLPPRALRHGIGHQQHEPEPRPLPRPRRPHHHRGQRGWPRRRQRTRRPARRLPRRIPQCGDPPRRRGRPRAHLPAAHRHRPH